nr:T cell immunomodulatory protein [Hymenolepis microstoma]
MPIDGPAGSSFTRVAAWAGVDLGAFVDVNSDRRTDAVVLKPSDSKLYALMAPTAKDTNGQFNQMELLPVEDGKKLLSIAVADFNADSIEDYLLVYRDSDYLVKVWLSGSNETVQLGEFKSQPIVCDANADMVADIYGENSQGRVIYYGGKSGNLTPQVFANSSSPLLDNAGFATLGTSMNPSLVLLTDGGIEVFSDLAVANNLQSPKMQKIALPSDVKANEIGKFVFGDFSMSSQIQLLLLTCPKGDCSKPQIWISSLGSSTDWEEVVVNLTPVGSKEGSWSLAPSTSSEFSTSFLVGPSLGDVDLDGFPDLAVGLKYSQGSNNIVLPAILRNTARSNGGRVEFQAHLLPGVEFKDGQNLKQIAFFDYNEDGILDLFMTHKGPKKEMLVTSLYMQKMTKEAYFLKVMLTTGLCGSPSRCPSGVLPYGLPGYGYRASYETQGAEGGRIGSSGSFVSTSCCGALQLPFVTFGFGDFATYIENVPVSVPAPPGQTRSHKLTFIVPNAQVVVIPYEYKNPDNWQAKSFLQPLYDIKVIVIAITLLSTCIILLVVIGVLQYLEIRADQKERMQESQRFHFDAM